MNRFTRNSISRMAAQGVGRLALFAWVTMIARVLSPDRFGIYAYLTTLAAILGILSDYGLGMYATRAVAQDRGQAGRYLTHTQILRFLLGVVAYLLLVVVVTKTPGRSEATLPALLFGLSIFTVSGINGFNAILNGREEIHLSSLMSALVPVLTLGIGATLLASGGNLVRAVIPTVVAGGIVLVSQSLLFRRIGIRYDTRLEPDFFKETMRRSAPLFLMSILTTLNVCLDTVLLNHMTDETTVGIYNASYKLVLALTILPVALGEAAFPVWSRTLRSKETQDELRLGSVIKLLVFVGLPVSICLYLVASPLIRLIFGTAYLDSISILKIHAWTLLFMFVNAPLGFRLVAAGRMRALNVTFATVVAFNLIGNLIVIPLYGGRGAAMATLGSEAINLLLLTFWVRRTASSLRVDPAGSAFD